MGSIVVPFGVTLLDSKYEPQTGTTMEPRIISESNQRPGAHHLANAENVKPDRVLLLRVKMLWDGGFLVRRLAIRPVSLMDLKPLTLRPNLATLLKRPKPDSTQPEP